ncbi:MAG TPA: hypothetical protein PKY29_04550 [Ferruginibacter sp.]|nr:hypothetical protein [Ferruginibacter sp.]HRQ20559.1 hypothetical protein [Ferruginibacter sp.]
MVKDVDTYKVFHNGVWQYTYLTRKPLETVLAELEKKFSFRESYTVTQNGNTVFRKEHLKATPKFIFKDTMTGEFLNTLEELAYQLDLPIEKVKQQIHKHKRCAHYKAVISN